MARGRVGWYMLPSGTPYYGVLPQGAVEIDAPSPIYTAGGIVPDSVGDQLVQAGERFVAVGADVPVELPPDAEQVSESPAAGGPVEDEADGEVDAQADKPKRGRKPAPKGDG